MILLTPSLSCVISQHFLIIVLFIPFSHPHSHILSISLLPNLFGNHHVLISPVHDNVFYLHYHLISFSIEDSMLYNLSFLHHTIHYCHISSVHIILSIPLPSHFLHLTTCHYPTKRIHSNIFHCHFFFLPP